MKSLTPEEKKLSSNAKKRANTAISKKRVLLGAQIRACTAPVQMQRKKELLCQFDALSLPLKVIQQLLKAMGVR